MLKHTGMAESVDALGSNPSEETRGGSSPPPGTKTCTQCKETLPSERFNTRNGKNGKKYLKSSCKLCESAYFREYRAKNRDRLLKQAKEYHAKNRERDLEYHREYYRQIKEDPVALAARRAANREAKREWAKRNPERVRETQRRYRERLYRDRERHAAYLQTRRTQREHARRLRAGNQGPVLGGFDPDAHEMVDAAPFIEWVHAERAKGRSFEVLADGSGVSPRSLRRVVEQKRATLDVIDRVLMNNDMMLWELGY